MKSEGNCRKAGIEKKDVDKAIKKLQKMKGKIESPKRCYYVAKLVNTSILSF